MKIYWTTLHTALDSLNASYHKKLLNDTIPEIQIVNNIKDSDIVIVVYNDRCSIEGTGIEQEAILLSNSNKPIIYIDCSERRDFGGTRDIKSKVQQFNNKYLFEEKLGNNLKAVFKSNYYNYIDGSWKTTKEYMASDIDIYPFELFPQSRFCNLNILQKDYPIHTKQEFDNRPIDIFMFGNLNNIPARMRFIDFLNDKFSDFNIITNKNDLKKLKSKNNIVILDRITNKHNNMAISEALDIGYKSKLCVSLEGTNPKCMRHLEVSKNAIMLKDGLDMKWTYPWIHGDNCLILPYIQKYTSKYDEMHKEIEEDRKYEFPMIDIENSKLMLDKYLNDENLYTIYLNGLKNYNNYTLPKYYTDYLIPLLKKYIK